MTSLSTFITNTKPLSTFSSMSLFTISTVLRTSFSIMLFLRTWNTRLLEPRSEFFMFPLFTPCSLPLQFNFTSTTLVYQFHQSGNFLRVNKLPDINSKHSMKSFYLHSLAQQNILSQPAFVNFLTYLQYWKEKEYSRFILCVYYSFVPRRPFIYFALIDIHTLYITLIYSSMPRSERR